MFDDVGTLLTNPGDFFDERAAGPSLTGPAAVVALLALLGVASTVVTLLQMMNALPEDVRPFFVVGGLFGSLVAVVVPLVTWLLYALAFHVITYFFDGEGEFRRTFIFTGWGFVPRLFTALVSLVVTVYVSTAVQPPADPAGFTAYSQQLQSSALLQASSAVGVLFTLWSAYIWVAAVQRARDVTRFQAAVAVAIPVAIAILLTVVSLVFTSLA